MNNNNQLKEIKQWERPIQIAFLIEIENEFKDTKGKEDYFHEFLGRELLKIEAFNLPEEIKKKFQTLSVEFNKYTSLSISSRRRLIVDTRKLIYKLNKSLVPKRDEIVRPKLKPITDTSNYYKNPNLFLDGIDLDSSICSLKGIGPKINEKLALLGISSVKELLEYYPRDYIDYSSLKSIADLEAGETATLIADVRRCSGFISPRNPNLAILDLHLFDLTGRIKVTKFFAGRRFSNQPYIRSQTRLYPPGTKVAISGLVKCGTYGKSISDPLIEVMQDKSFTIKSRSIGQLLPIYSLTEGLSAERFRELMIQALPLTSLVKDPLDKKRINSLSLLSKQEALMNIHKPTNRNLLSAARRRLVFDEFLLLQLGLLRKRLIDRSRSAPSLKLEAQSDGLVAQFLSLLPFSPTNSQKRVLSEIQADLSLAQPMARLLQGDVGSGKTIVALASLIHAVQCGFQGALMAPTEVLAEQHYRNFCKWLPQIHITVDILTGSTTKLRRKTILDDLANGSLKILVGTHALIEDPVGFSCLGLVVVDEQHRFGVKQRNRLLSKGLQPHLLAMTATPIPRTLALSIHGDLDVSQIDELPPGRSPIKTVVLSGSQRNKAYELIRKQVNAGQQAYVVLPLVDESEKLDLSSAINVHEKLSTDIFPDLKVGLLHGRMNSRDKQSVIKAFASGQCQILVSTTVVEVGVDVPEATIMMIDNADRFGLAQLHQLRGRVGRGKKQSHCLLINDSKNEVANQRLDVLERTNNGFEISEIDLQLRGPGQVLGTRQSGLPDFVLASLTDDASVLEEARKEANFLLDHDPNLIAYPFLKKLVSEHWERLSGAASLN